MEILNNNPHEHVEHKKADKEQEGNEIGQTPFVKILNWLK